MDRSPERVQITRGWLLLTLLLLALSHHNAAAQKKPWYENITFKAWMQLDATFPEGNAVTGSTSNFRIRRARPTIIAQIDPLTKVQLQWDLSTGKAGSGASSATIVDTYVERVIPSLGAYVRFGQALLPFGHEIHEDNAALRSPLELSYAAEQIALAERDIGLFLHSVQAEEALWHWEFAFVNGQGFRSADANANKAFVGRLCYMFHPCCRLGVSSILGTYRGNNVDYDRHVLGLEAQFHINKALSLEGEFYNVRFVDNPSNPTKSARFNGGYLMFETWIGPLKSIPFIRYQRTYGDLDYQSYDIGWRYQYTPTQRLTLEYDIVKGSKRDSLGARWQVIF